MDYTDVQQVMLKTPADLRHHLNAYGQARHIIHDSETGWWWFCNDRNRLLEFVFNSGRQVVLKAKPALEDDLETRWEAQCDLIAGMQDFKPCQTFLSTAMSPDILTDLFWTDFLSQDLGRYAYWDVDNPYGGLEEHIFYWEMFETGAHTEPPGSADSRRAAAG
jgi:hypothetical protein